MKKSTVKSITIKYLNCNKKTEKFFIFIFEFFELEVN